MDSSSFDKVTFADFKWMNEPKQWRLVDNNTLEVTTDSKKDFWQGTLYNFYFNSGHVFGVRIKGDFTFEVCVEGDYNTLYDQAGLMVYLDEKHWLKTGIEYNDGQSMVSSVLTNEFSDWGTGIFPGDPRKFYIRVTRLKDVICVKYSVDNITWTLLRLGKITEEEVLVGPVAMSPTREGLNVKFSNVKITTPAADILHSN